MKKITIIEIIIIISLCILNIILFNNINSQKNKKELSFDRTKIKTIDINDYNDLSANPNNQIQEGIIINKEKCLNGLCIKINNATYSNITEMVEVTLTFRNTQKQIANFKNIYLILYKNNLEIDRELLVDNINIPNNTNKNYLLQNLKKSVIEADDFSFVYEEA